MPCTEYIRCSTVHIIVTTAVFIIIPVLCGVQMIPERVKIVNINEKYIHNYSFVIKRYSRHSGYFINAEATLKYQWGNNVTFHVVFYEFLHNEYRRSFIELHYKYCDLLNKEKFVGSRIRDYGIKCPLTAGRHLFMNFTVPMDEFPNVFPYEYARVDIDFAVTATGESIIKTYLYAHFKNVVHKH